MSQLARLFVLPGFEPHTVLFRLAFPVPLEDGGSVCLPAALETGDGHTLDLGAVCTPTSYLWRTQQQLNLAEHTYTGNGPFAARLTWGETVLLATVKPGNVEEMLAQTTHTVNVRVDVQQVAGYPLLRSLLIEVTGLAADQSVRVDGDAGQVITISGADGTDHSLKFPLGYPKPGDYTVVVQVLDAEGFWLDTLSETPVPVAEPAIEPIRPVSEDVVVYAAPEEITAVAAEPWLPFRYAHPVWAGVRTYTAPGGSYTSRVLGSGVYLAIIAETNVGNQLWYRTAGNDWVAADYVNIVKPSDLRGVELAHAAPPPPGVRRGVVTADLLNVRARPGAGADNPAIDRLAKGTEVAIFEETRVGGNLWYRIGEGRWVAGAFVRVLDQLPGPRRGVTTPASLNVRARPGVAPDNPPIDRLAQNTEVVVYEETRVSGDLWYRIGDSRWVAATYVRIIGPVAAQMQAANAVVANAAAKQGWMLPVGWVVSDTLNARARPGATADNPAIDQLLHNQALSVLEVQIVDGEQWYRIGDERWVIGKWVGVARYTARPSSIRANERWVGVNLIEQTAVAYEGDQPVYAALVATGLPSTPTVQGVFRTWQRLTSCKMSGGNPTGGYYYLEGVTWTCYFYRGYGLHTAYWHDGFGRPRSHGCVNFSPYDAWWIFQWSAAGGDKSPAVYVYR